MARTARRIAYSKLHIASQKWLGQRWTTAKARLLARSSSIGSVWRAGCTRIQTTRSGISQYRTQAARHRWQAADATSRTREKVPGPPSRKQKKHVEGRETPIKKKYVAGKLNRGGEADPH